MSYSTATSILLILPGMPQTTTSNGYTPITNIITSHITRADNVINGKIARRYDVSGFVASVPPLLQTLSEDITSYYTYRSEFSADGQNDNEYTDKFKDALMILDEIMKGDLDLVDSSGQLIDTRDETPTGEGFVKSNTETYTPTFGEDSSLSWKVDSDKLDDLRSSR